MFRQHLEKLPHDLNNLWSGDKNHLQMICENTAFSIYDVFPPDSRSAFVKSPTLNVHTCIKLPVISDSLHTIWQIFPIDQSFTYYH